MCGVTSHLYVAASSPICSIKWGSFSTTGQWYQSPVWFDDRTMSLWWFFVDAERFTLEGRCWDPSSVS
jgi:hypothetical protein